MNPSCLYPRRDLLRNSLVEGIALCFLCLLTLLPSAYCATIEISTRDDRDVNLPSVEIKVFRADRFEAIGVYMTDSEGAILIPHLPPGYYRVLANRQGFEMTQTHFLRLWHDSYQRIVIHLLPLLTTGVSDILASSIKTRETRFPSLLSSIPIISDQLPYSFETFDHLTDLGLLIHDSDRNVLFSSSRSFDSHVTFDQFDLTDPAFQRPYLLPPSLFLSDIDIISAGVDAFYPLTTAGSIGLFSTSSSDDPLSVTLLRSQSVYNGGAYTSAEADAAFDYWQTNANSEFERPSENPSIENTASAFIVQSKHSSWNVLAAGTLLSSSQFPESGFVNDDLRDMWNIWLKSEIRIAARTDLTIVSGYEDNWLRIINPYRLRGQDPIYSHSTSHFAAASLRYRMISGDLIEFDVYSLASNREKGEPESWHSIARFNSSDLNDDEYDFRYWGQWDSQRLGVSTRYQRTSTSHIFAINGSIGLLDVSGKEILQPGSLSDETSIQTFESAYSSNEYTLSVWGRDRWFATSNLDLTTIVRWDRYNYLDQRDNLTPRINIGYHKLGLRFYGGIERIVQPPPIAYVKVRINPDFDDEPAQYEPTTGFRLFAGVGGTNSYSITYSMGVFHSILSNPVETVQTRLFDSILQVLPVQSDEGTRDGISIDMKYQHGEMLGIEMGYEFTYAQFHASSSAPASFFRTDPSSRFPERDDLPSFSNDVDLDDSIHHHVRGLLSYLLVSRFDLWADLAYYFSSGRPYTPVIYSPINTGEYYFGEINSRRAPGWHRFDFRIRKALSISSFLKIQAAIQIKNIFNTWQDAPVDPSTDRQAFDPYSIDSNCPRMILLEAGITF